MQSLEDYIDDLLSRGRSYFSKAEILKLRGGSAAAFTSAATRLIKKQRLAMPHRGFYLILRPEDRVIGAPDPVRWIDPLMKYLEQDYRISLLRAASFHGSSHQSSMVFQVVTPKQMREIKIGRHRVQFLFQESSIFSETNRAEFLSEIKSESGFAKGAGIELLLLDSARYFHRAGGFNGFAQIVHDIGMKAKPLKLARCANYFENSTVRRLGYLLDYFEYKRQAKSLTKFVQKARSYKLLDPSIKQLIDVAAQPEELNRAWMLVVNEQVEIDL